MSDQPPILEFRPNIYPVMYWALAFGVAAGLLLLLVAILARYITLVWFPVFLLGLVWGGFRNYQRQKQLWLTSNGLPATRQSMVNEFKEAFYDIRAAAQDLANQQAEVDQEVVPDTEESERRPIP